MATSQARSGSLRTSVPAVAGLRGTVPALVAANVIWGTSFVASKPLLDTLPSATLAIGRLLFALMILLPVVKLTGRSVAFGRTPAILGSSGIVLTVLLQNFGLERTSATNASCLSGAVPAITVLLSFLLLRQVPGRIELMAVGVSIAGVVAIVLSDAGAKASLSPAGDALILASAVFLALYLVLGSRHFRQVDPISLVAGSSLYGLLMLLPFAGYELATAQVSLPDVRSLMILVYLGAGASALAYCLEGLALRELGSSHVAMFGNLAPVVGVAASAILLRESVSALQTTGAVLVISGAWLVTWQPNFLCHLPVRSPRFAQRQSAEC